MTTTTPAKPKKQRPTIREMLRDHYVAITFRETITDKVSVDAYLRPLSTLRKYYTNPSMNFTINADYFHNDVNKGYTCPRCDGELAPFAGRLSTDATEAYHACTSKCGVHIQSALISNSRDAKVDIPSVEPTSMSRDEEVPTFDDTPTFDETPTFDDEPSLTFDPTTGSFIPAEAKEDFAL